MKKWIPYILAALLLLPTALGAQNRPSRENIVRYNAERMAGSLSLEGKTRADFVSLYSEFYSEMMGLRSELRRRPDTKPENDREIEERILADFEMSRKILDLRESYFQKFRTILPAAKILQMYQLEKQHAEKHHDSD